MVYEYLYVRVNTSRDSLNGLNGWLAKGWEPVREASLGDGPGHFSLVLLRRPKEINGGGIH